MPTIEASRLTKVYRTYRKERGLWGSVKGLLRRRYDETRAADQVSFQIEEGEFVGFLGPNGAGKTTVLKMLSGLLNPTSGDARVLGFVPWERRNEMKRQSGSMWSVKSASASSCAFTTRNITLSRSSPAIICKTSKNFAIACW